MAKTRMAMSANLVSGWESFNDGGRYFVYGLLAFVSALPMNSVIWCCPPETLTPWFVTK